MATSDTTRIQRESRVREFIMEYREREGYSPTVREIQAELGISLERTHTVIQGMIEDGRLIGRPSTPRTLRVTEAVMPETGEVL